MAKSALIVIHEGFEDIETAAPIDVLTRAKVKVTLAGPQAGAVKGAWGTVLVADKAIADIEELHDALVLPGGLKNAQALAADARVLALIRGHLDAGKVVASLCASPALVLAEAAGILKGRCAAGDPSFNDRLAAAGAAVRNQGVCVDGSIITATGPGSAIEFALPIAEALGCGETARQLRAKWLQPAERAL